MVLTLGTLKDINLKFGAKIEFLPHVPGSRKKSQIETMNQMNSRDIPLAVVKGKHLIH